MQFDVFPAFELSHQFRRSDGSHICSEETGKTPAELAIPAGQTLDIQARCGSCGRPSAVFRGT